MEPVIRRPGEGELIEKEHRKLFVKGSWEQMDFLEYEGGPDYEGAGPHFRKLHVDSFYVLEGELEFRTGDEVVIATADTFVLSPPGVVHSFRNAGTEPARLLNLHTPGGFIEYRRELMALHEQGIQPDEAFFERHDVFDPD